MMIAALTMAGLPTRNAGATKNALAGVMNASAVLLFITSPQVHWGAAIALGAGAIVGGLCGTWALHKVTMRHLGAAQGQRAGPQGHDRLHWYRIDYRFVPQADLERAEMGPLNA